MYRILFCRGRRTCLPVLVLVGVAHSTAAVTVHTWVDEAGVRHYADAPPAGDAPSSESFVIDDLERGDAASDYYSIANQWARLRAEREARAARELERERSERAAREAARAERAAEAAAREHYGPRYLLGPWGYPYPPYRGRRTFPLDRDSYTAQKRRGDFVPRPVPPWPRERATRDPPPHQAPARQ